MKPTTISTSFIPSPGVTSNFNRISRFTANGNFTLPDSEVILFELAPVTGTIHNGGAMVFGSDGKLYIAVGDGANPQAGDVLLFEGSASDVEDGYYT